MLFCLVPQSDRDETASISMAGAVTGPGSFPTTHWSVVLAVGQGSNPAAQAALEKICRAYWYPLYV